MADKLEWMNAHLVLLRHLTLRDAQEKEQYKLRPDLAPFAPAADMRSEDFIRALAEAGKYKEACDFLAYAMHRRAAIWWGYRCLLALNDELRENPAAERDIADIGAPKEMPVPDWAKIPPEMLADAEKKKAEALAKLKETKALLESRIAELKKQIPPETQALWDEAYGAVNARFKEVHGITLEELVEKAARKSAGPSFQIDPNSPIFQAADKLRAEIEEKRKETVDLIKSVLPPKVPEHEKKLTDDAMTAIYRWVVAPDDGNSRKALDVGNACPDRPAGLMALAAFWSFGNMTPGGERVVPTPPGLAANGVCSALLQAALHKGGTRKYAERCKLYLELGLEVARGESTWGESVAQTLPPHAAERAPENRVPAGPRPVPPTYRKWTPPVA